MPISTNRTLEIHQDKNLKDFVRDCNKTTKMCGPPRSDWDDRAGCNSQPASARSHAPIIPDRSSSITYPVGI